MLLWLPGLRARRLRCRGRPRGRFRSRGRRRSTRRVRRRESTFSTSRSRTARAAPGRGGLAWPLLPRGLFPRVGVGSARQQRVFAWCSARHLSCLYSHHGHGPSTYIQTRLYSFLHRTKQAKLVPTDRPDATPVRHGQAGRPDAEWWRLCSPLACTVDRKQHLNPGSCDTDDQSRSPGRQPFP